VKTASSHRKLLVAMALLTAALGLSAPSKTDAASGFISPTQPTTYVVAGGYYDSGVTLKALAPANPAYVNVQISDQSLLRVGWKVKLDTEIMLIQNLIEGGSTDTMVVWRGYEGTFVGAHNNGAAVKGPTVTVDIWAKDVVASPYGLGAFQLYLNFPPEVEPIKVSLDYQWLASTGRDPWCNGPTHSGSLWEMSCFTLPNPGPDDPSWYPAGPNGSGIIGHVRVLPPESGIAMVSLSGSYLVDVQSNMIPIGVQNMSFRIVACPDADLNGSINVLDAYQTALQWGDRGRDCGVTLASAANNTQTTLDINDQSLAWWNVSACAAAGTNRPNQVAVDAEIMTAGAFTEGSPDTVAVTRGVNSTIAKSHLAGAAVYLIPSQWDGNYDGKNGYTATRDIDHNGTVNLLDTLVIVNVMGMQCP
jgi:hypothetical protein